MRKLLLGLVALLLVLVVGLAALVLVGPSLVDLRPRVAAAVRDATGHDLTISRLDVSLVPALSVTASDAHLSDGKGGELAALGQLSLRMEWWPLLSGRVVIDRLVLDRPAVALAVDEHGVANWQLRPAHPAGTAGAGNGGSGKHGGYAVELREMRVEDGRLTYRNALTGQKLSASAISLTGGTSGKTDWRLALTLNGAPVTGSFSVDSAERLQAGLPAALALSVKAPAVTASYKGTVQSQPPGLNGTFDLDVPSVGALFAWLDRKLDHDPGPLRMQMETASDGGKLTLRHATISGKAIRLTASGTLDATRTPPVFDASIAIPEADLDAYLPPPPAAPAPAAPAPAPGPAAPPGWSTAPYDFSALGGANGHLALTIGRLKLHGQTLSDGVFDVTLGKRVLRLTKGQAKLSGGEIAAGFTLDAAASPPRLELDTTIKGLGLRPLLAAFAGTDRLGGTLSATARLTAQGANQKQMVESLSGAGQIAIAHGAIYGVDLQKSLREIGNLRLATGPGERTEFSSASGSYTIRAGVLTNNDLAVASPVANLAGAGTVSLPPQSLAYTVQVRLAPGRGIASALSAVAIPLHISGPWRAPKVEADWSGVIGHVDLKSVPKQLDRVVPNPGRLLPGLLRR